MYGRTGRYHAAFASHAHYEKPKFAGTQFVLKHYASNKRARARARCSAHVLGTLHVCVLCVGWRRRGAIHVALHHTQPLLVLVLELELHTR